MDIHSNAGVAKVKFYQSYGKTKHADYYVIQNEVFGIIGTGISEEIAVQAFAEEFDHLYQVLNGLNDGSITEHNKQIKGFINYYVETIE